MDVIYVDNHLLIVFKPPGVLSQADETGDPDLLTLGKAWLKQRFKKPGNVFLGLVHRLDRPVSGVMVLARTSKAATRLTNQFKSRAVSKGYLAIVTGHLTGKGEWEDHLVKENRLVRVVSSNHPKAKPARLAWEALAHQDGTTLVSIKLFTGRPHQIRVQFASRRHALLGDFRYHSKRPFDGQNLALHSWRLQIEHPTRKEPMLWTVAPPPGWDGWYGNTIRQLLSDNSPEAD